ncbi:30S ribosomal protein S4 [archaeon]|nr:30S ribosomal protein S4 [archaeon]|tara:strand:+ start:1797 stop:2330 length:534 start_codon:yes stop_codon:yes gene_type:complete
MGDPKKQRKKYSKPKHPWEEGRIKEEKELKMEYGLKNKKEIWKTESKLKKIKDQTKRLITNKTEQAKKEEKELLLKLYKLGLIKKSAKLDDILSLDLKSILDRRLQTLVFKKNLSTSVKQARQFITHGHITISSKKIDVPSYLVNLDEENKISFFGRSLLSKDDHPEAAKLDKNGQK